MSLRSQLEVGFHRITHPFERFKPSNNNRRHERFSCYIFAIMAITDRSLTFDGVVDSISQGGIQFHPASKYILERKKENVTITLGEQNFHGIIVATRPSGYGIALNAPLTKRELEQILAEHG
jgi:hypothetical protein